MDPRDLLDALARSARMPVVARVRHVEGRSRDEVLGRWILLGAHRNRATAMEAIRRYMMAHEGRAMQVTIVDASHPEYRATLAAARRRSRRSRG